MMTWVETAVHFVEMSAIVSCTSHLVQKHFRASKLTSDVMWKIRDSHILLVSFNREFVINLMSELFMVLLFGVSVESFLLSIGLIHW
ncbi:hypothetical protein DAPPUDRAFT_271335 [Daphnia pulex]|uniref:Uncharacterized protein n=1 Tax=Daphnia pulex TaxID=6669 RepID=E9I202_DAPPU|nr:hypothetical protein DAPPUDRAFT_271335 [Daphnia pulex]|eukprot:EFX61977.1 hypothetical protein DAPPUDRAFT_271335 [Daphnia pulex]